MDNRNTNHFRIVFGNASAFNADISAWNVEKVTSLGYANPEITN
jgi:surface protein